MQYDQGAEKVAMTGGAYTPATRVLALYEDLHVQRPRKILLIMLGICLALCLVNTVVGITGRTENSQGRTQIGLSVLSICFYGFGLLVTLKYSQTGLRVFAWLGVILLISTGVVLGFLVIVALGGLAIASVAVAALNTIDDSSFTNSTAINSADKTDAKSAMIGISVTIFVFFLIAISSFIFTIVMVKFAFKLARLIEGKKSLTIQQI